MSRVSVKRLVCGYHSHGRQHERVKQTRALSSGMGVLIVKAVMHGVYRPH